MKKKIVLLLSSAFLVFTFFAGILSDLEQSADAEVEIDAKKKLGLRQFTEYRSRRALSRMVFPVLAYVTSHPAPSVFV